MSVRIIINGRELSVNDMNVEPNSEYSVEVVDGKVQVSRIDLMAENAKLRELSRDMLACILATKQRRSICWECPRHHHVDELRAMCFIKQDARKLGIEVDEWLR